MLGFLPLLPALAIINRANRESGIEFPPSAHWRARSILLFAVGALASPLAILGAFGPSTRVLESAEVRHSSVRYLERLELIQSRDELLFFYSPGFFSMRGDGAVLTDRGVGAYWTDIQNNELPVVFTEFSEISHVLPVWSTTWFDDTVVTVEASDGSWFSFLLSTEDGGDRRFVEELERRQELAR